MVFNLSLVVLLVTFGLMSLSAVLPLSMKGRSIHLIWIVFIISCSVCVFYNKPGLSTDLSRHYSAMERMNYGMVDLQYGGVYLFNLILWVISKTNQYALLPSLNFLVIGILIDSIVKKYAKNLNVAPRTIFIYYFFVLGCIGITSIVSGIRCALVSAIFVWGYVYFKGSKKSVFYAISIAICFIHMVGVMLIAFSLIYDILMNTQKKLQNISSVIVIIVLMRYIIYSGILENIVSFIPGVFGKTLSIKIADYMGINVVDSVMIPIWLNVRIILVLLILLISYFKNYQDDMIAYFIFVFALVGGVDGTARGRLLMPVSLLMFPNINTIYQGTKSNSLRNVRSAIMFTACFYMVFSSTYSLCAHVLFNGVNYRDILAPIIGR